MKKCNDCGAEMIENAEIIGQHPFEIGADGSSDIFVGMANGKIKTKSIFGKVKEVDNYREHRLKARVCPNCGKVELYIEPNE